MLKNAKDKLNENLDCFVNETEDFSVVTSIQCKIRRFPDNENIYGIKRTDTDKEIIEKAFKVPSYKFILRRYWYFAISLFFITVLCFFAMPVSMLLSFVLYGVYYHFYKPYSTSAKARKTQTYFYFLSVIIGLLIFYLLFFTHNYQQALKISQGLLYGLIIDYALFYFIGLFHKYGEIYALGIEELENWTIARSFVWRSL